ncbi:MAG: hypothetical protein MI741_16325, partial [Rhodospirillales bacterium]|nr:hypothetical protein [Rhodospirillales bacterium]
FPKRELAFITADYWAFDRKMPKSPEARKALAIYREALNAQHNFMVPYAVLGYYKLIELKYKKGLDIKEWFRSNYETIRKNPNLAENVARFEMECGSDTPEAYLYNSCRCAVAHAKRRSTDPDNFHELRKLHNAADILRALARLFIGTELGVSDCLYDSS